MDFSFILKVEGWYSCRKFINRIFFFSLFLNRVYFLKQFRFIAKLSRKYRGFPYTNPRPPPHIPTHAQPRSISLLHQSGVCWTLRNLYWYIIVTQSPQLTWKFNLGGVYSMDLDKLSCHISTIIIACVALKIFFSTYSFSFTNPWQPLIFLLSPLFYLFHSPVVGNI